MKRLYTDGVVRREWGKGVRGFFTILLLFLTPVLSSAQGKEANIWYFPNFVGLDFNTGSPPTPLTDGMNGSIMGTCASIADSNGNLQFYSDGETIWNRNHDEMQNGNNMGVPFGQQGVLIVPDPGNVNKYYYFNFGYRSGMQVFQYSVIDMTLDNGKGAVLYSHKCIELIENVSNCINAVMCNDNEDNESIWVVAHGYSTSFFYSFKVTSDSLYSTPVTSSAGDIVLDGLSGFLKISPNGKYLGISQSNDLVPSFFQLFNFNSSTGVVENRIFSLFESGSSGAGIEFSPDNSKLYLNYKGAIVQYNLKAGNTQQIIESEIVIADLVGFKALQLGPDGKIYYPNEKFVSAILDPNKLGLDCDYQEEYIQFDYGYWAYTGLPTFIQSYLNDPEYNYNSHCFGEPTQFNIVNTHGIDSVKWKFWDWGNYPNDTSTLFTPQYTFSAPGTYYPELTVWSGYMKKTVIDTVIIYAIPNPDFGPDTLFCPDDPISLTLNAGTVGQYYWNGSLSPGDSIFVVADTGTYRVRVNNHGCIGRDTINVSRYGAATADISNADFKPSSCNLSDGAITGIVFDAHDLSEVKWINASVDTIGTGADLTGIPAGSYSAIVTYGSGCTQSFGPYDIYDNGAIQIADISKEDDHCGQMLGALLIIPAAGNPDDYLYSVNGIDYYDNGGVFDSLPAGPYAITIKNLAGCISAVVHDTIADLPGPDITCFAVPASGTSADGSITVISSAINLTYQLEGGQPQTGNVFTGLVADTYYVMVMDEFGCITRDTVEVGTSQGSMLVALADGDRKCLYNPANSDIQITRVTEMTDLKATLYFNDNLLNCTHFNGNNATFPGIMAALFTQPARIELAWHGVAPVSSTDTLLLGSMIFETMQYGTADINWEADSTSTCFLNQLGDTIKPVLLPGIIEVFEIPEAEISGNASLCEGESTILKAEISGGMQPIEYAWITPEGSVPSTEFSIDNASAADAGIYTFVMKDNLKCANSATIDIQVIPLPAANFPETNDTIWYEQSYFLAASQGYASYQWNTGDTIYYITVTNEGKYSVIIQTEEGCKSADTVMMMNAFVPIQVPNAFTPNGDGLNDVFRPVVDTELLRQFHLSIYNKWGECIFETSDATKGWDGENAMAGVYVWVISYANRVGKSDMMKGSVAVVR